MAAEPAGARSPDERGQILGSLTSPQMVLAELERISNERRARTAERLVAEGERLSLNEEAEANLAEINRVAKSQRP